MHPPHRGQCKISLLLASCKTICANGCVWEKSMERNSVVSPFLRLPGELRSKIYGYVLGGHALRIGYSPHVRKTKTIKGQRYHVHAGGGLFNRLVEHEVIDHRYEKALSLHLGLLRVCRQVYGEAALLPYAMNTFTFENDWVLRRCFKTLRPTQKRAMTKFAIQYE